MRTILIILLTSSAHLTVLPASSQPNLANGVAVIVNDSVITLQDIRNLIRPELEFLSRRYAGQPLVLEQKRRELEQEKIDELVQRKLILHEFETSGYSMPESYIQSKIDEDIRQHGDRLTMTKTLQAEGMTREQYRKRVRERIIVEAMWQHNVSQDIIISPYKIEQYYQSHQDDYRVGDQVKLRMIVIPKENNGGLVDARKLAEEALTKIQEGVPFADMANVYSHGSRQRQGGDWGWVERSVLREDLSEKAFSLKAGETAIVDADDAVYLMLVEELKPKHVRPISEVRDEIESTLKAEKRKELRTQWINRLKEKSFIRYY